MLNVKKRQYPNGWHTIKATLDDFEIDMCIARAKDELRRGKREVEAFWPLVQIRHQQPRCIYDMYYTRKIISKELLEYCLENDIADKNLIDEWKNKGQENLCCLRCIPRRDSRLDTICNCRIVECVHCGCKGCSA
ncbi:hypothetical protein ACJMK2_003515 [Sinanodonta woodiana]|uniref:Protein BUD31 homolog n=1 Tax=Sinanodonta woodiana TaxID=1069815 RepID=A0ABD3XZ54_SINWO